MPSSGMQNSQNGQWVSARRVEYDTTSTGVLLSAPFTSDLPHSNWNENSTQYQEGYNSNGEIGPFFDAVANQREDDDEEEQEKAAENIASEEHDQPIEPAADLPNFYAMNVVQLKDELRKRNLPVNWRNKIVIQHLLAPWTENSALGQQDCPQHLTGFAPNSKWSDLKCSDELMQEPNQQHPRLVGPTVPTGQSEAWKFNFTETFDQPLFTAMSSPVKVNSNGKPLHNKNGQQIYQSEFWEQGRAHLGWLKASKLTIESTPAWSSVTTEKEARGLKCNCYNRRLDNIH
jgi:hypothetical protein